MPIKGELFSQQFIPKLLDGTKTRTSRPTKLQESLSGDYEFVRIDGSGNFGFYSESGKLPIFLKPKYRPGDIMYARETWNILDGKYQYRADLGDFDFNDSGEKINFRWRPSIHMPREAARIFLRVTDVKVQNVYDLTEQDAVQDGFEPSKLSVIAHKVVGKEYTALDKFKRFWRKQYGANAEWMWVYYFKLISKEEAYADN